MRRPRTLAGRLAAMAAALSAAPLAALGALLVVVLHPGPGGRVILGAGLALAWASCAAAAFLAGRGLGRSLARMAAAVPDLRSGPSVGEGEAGPEEVARMARALRDLGERLRREVEEAESERRTRESILSAMEEGVVLVEGPEVRYVNPAAGRLLGGIPGDLRALAPHALRRLVDEARAVARPRAERTRVGHPERIVRAAAVPLDGGDRVLLVLRDITDQARVEAMRRDFVADASHELKTPVASIQAAAETLERVLEEDPRAVGRFARTLRDESVRLSRLIGDLLDLSRLEAEAPAMEPVRLDRVVAEQARRFLDRARRAGVDLTVEAEEAEVVGDPKDLGLLVSNLLDNAIRYTGAGGSVRVRVGRLDGRAVVSVQDTGIGIPGRDLPRIFERFYRVDRARSRDTGGTGLGLSIARHVAEMHGGRIEAESELGRGSTFRVSLPARG